MADRNAYVRKHQIIDLIRDLDQAFELLYDTPPNLRGFAPLTVRDCDCILSALKRAADFLHELRERQP